MIEIFLAGEPRGKGRPRFVRATGRTFTPKDTVTFESALKLSAQMAMEGKAMILGAITVRVLAVFSIPKSFSAKKRRAAIEGDELPCKAPDVDNLLKCMDAFNKVVWLDDKQVVAASVRKIYGETPGTTFTVHDFS